MGWDPPSKKQELFHRDSRFVIIRRPQAQDRPDSLCAEIIPIMAYSMFRFDMEDDECVLYWYCLAFKFILRQRPADPSPRSQVTHFYFSSYELQVSQSAQRGGIGKRLMECLHGIARGWKMQKVMLTVFKGDNTSVLRTFPPRLRATPTENQAAFLFYKAMGFVCDSSLMCSMC
jgi:GNAT superfamily N-acetyltransferase